MASPPVVKKLSAFFFGNNVPLEKFKIFIAFAMNLTQKTSQRKLIISIGCGKHLVIQDMAHYYNMLHRTFIWINGQALHQLETQKPEVTVMDFGIAGTYCEPEIRAKLKLLLGVENS
jgi:hypothetical protein